MSEIADLMNEQIRTLVPYLTVRDGYEGPLDILLDANESWLGGTDGVNRYPDPQCVELRKEIERVIGLPWKMTAITNGSDEAIDLIIRIFCRPGIDSVMVSDPTFGEYGIFASLNSVRTINVPQRADYMLDVERMLAEIDEKRPKLVFICSPNNPTGILYPEDDILRIAEHNKGITVIDEAYIDFTGTEGLWKRIMENPRIIVFRTMSKAWALAGARVGIIVGCEEVIEAVMKAKAPYNVSRLSQDAAMEMLRRQDEVRELVSEAVSERERMAAFLKTLPYVTEVFPSVTNFLLFRTPEAGKLYEHLLANRIIVRSYADDPILTGCLRFSVSSRSDNDKVMEVLSGFRI